VSRNGEKRCWENRKRGWCRGATLTEEGRGFRGRVVETEINGGEETQDAKNQRGWGHFGGEEHQPKKTTFPLKSNTNRKILGFNKKQNWLIMGGPGVKLCGKGKGVSQLL